MPSHHTWRMFERMFERIAPAMLICFVSTLDQANYKWWKQKWADHAASKPRANCSKLNAWSMSHIIPDKPYNALRRKVDSVTNRCNEYVCHLPFWCLFIHVPSNTYSGESRTSIWSDNSFMACIHNVNIIPVFWKYLIFDNSTGFWYTNFVWICKKPRNCGHVLRRFPVWC